MMRESMAVHEFKRTIRTRTTDHAMPKPPVDTGGGGGDDGHMEARISALEAANLETRDRLARIETRLDSVATKADLHELGASLNKSIVDQTWKMIGWMTTICTALVAITAGIVKLLSH
ncbi:hypothetical protein [Burkholderia multivorans]|uniref:hypothetical protein n=1 Tax=Burkholderia multivorans TaxID=87883 RepID=UPI000B5A363A|nr:hypothetical protein [Burkholderia multivorans]MBN6728765.1 hypothetical protein [Burkholderia multivorans]MCA8480208.1 hypothetical protein [Burkholderia multivorans]MDN8078312.1 hypothetical protein [Burkholderia multivorans]